MSDANSYTLEIDDDPAFGSIDYTVTVTGSTEHTVTIYLEQETTYRWRVRGNNECGGGDYSNFRTFFGTD